MADPVTDPLTAVSFMASSTMLTTLNLASARKVRRRTGVGFPVICQVLTRNLAARKLGTESTWRRHPAGVSEAGQPALWGAAP